MADDSDGEIGAAGIWGKSRKERFGETEDIKEDKNHHTPNAAEAALQGENGEQPMETQRPALTIPPKPATPEEEKQYIKELEAKANLEGIKLGQTWYVLATKWWKGWKDYTSYDW